MTSRDRPQAQPPSEEVLRTRTGTRPLSGGPASGSPLDKPPSRSGEYPAVIAPAPVLPEDDRLTPTEPLATAGQPLPSIRKPFASLTPMTKIEAQARPVSEPPPPSIRRPLSAGPQRKLGSCPLHKVTLSPNGDCVLCKREADERTKSRWSRVALGLVVLVAILAGLALAN